MEQKLKISEWFETLPEPYRTQALENFKEQKCPNKYVENVAEAIDTGMYFEVTPQKHDYWWHFYNELSNGRVNLSPLPAPVNTWIPVEDLDKYKPIGEPKDVIATDGLFSGYAEFSQDINAWKILGFMNTVTHIMIIEPPKTTQNATQNK